jgi:hypothetical protein
MTGFGEKFTYFFGRMLLFIRNVAFRIMQDNEPVICGEKYFQMVQNKTMDYKEFHMDLSNRNHLLNN